MHPRLPPRRRASLPRPSKGNRARVQSPATRAGASVPLPGTRAPSGARAPRAGRGTMRAAGTGQPQRPPDRMRVLIPRPLRGQRAAAERAPMNWLNEVLNNDPDPAESQEWIESLKAVIDTAAPARAHQLPTGLVEPNRRAGAHLTFAPTTEYINTIPPGQEAKRS